MPRRKWTKDEIWHAISEPGAKCPSCGAEWSDPVEGDGTPVRNPVNQVMIHDVECPAYVEPRKQDIV